ncbi:MAG: hypothetical protein AMXMBFR4_27790 [Candidatus Hydrogenedentota bacterium]
MSYQREQVAAEFEQVGHGPSPTVLFVQIAGYLIALAAAYLALWIAWPNAKSVEAARRTMQLADVLRPILFFGDSSAEFYEEGETDQRGILAMLDEMLPESGVGSAANSGFTLPLFRDMFTLLQQPKSRVHTAIICVNLGFLSPAWYMRPDPFYCQSRYFLKYNGIAAQAFYRPLVAFRAVSPVSYAQVDRDRTPLYFENRRFLTVGEMERFLEAAQDTPEADRTAAIAIYMQPCTAQNPSVQALIDLVRKCRDAGIRPIPYISPINVEHGEKLLGPAFREQTEHNIAVLCKLLADEEIEPLNLAFDLPHEVFEKRHPMSTHLTAPGRTYVAQRLRDAIAQADGVVQTATTTEAAPANS